MVAISELVIDAAEMMLEQKETVAAYARSLIDGGLLPKSRGRAVAQAEPEHVLRLLVVVALNPKIKDAPSVASQYMALVEGGVPSSAPSSLRRTFEDWLLDCWAALMSDDHPREREVYREVTIEIVNTWPEAIVTYPDGKQVRFLSPDDIGQHWKAGVKRSTVISGRALVLLGFGRGLPYHASTSDK